MVYRLSVAAGPRLQAVIGQPDSACRGCLSRGHASPDSRDFSYDRQMTDYIVYIVYIDESGDHGLNNINRDHPVFVLAFCVVEKTKYTDKIVPVFQRLTKQALTRRPFAIRRRQRRRPHRRSIRLIA